MSSYFQKSEIILWQNIHVSLHFEVMLEKPLISNILIQMIEYAFFNIQIHC